MLTDWGNRVSDAGRKSCIDLTAMGGLRFAGCHEVGWKSFWKADEFPLVADHVHLEQRKWDTDKWPNCAITIGHPTRLHFWLLRQDYKAGLYFMGSEVLRSKVIEKATKYSRQGKGHKRIEGLEKFRAIPIDLCRQIIF